MKTWAGRHAQVLLSTLGAMRRSPMVSINTICIIAITLLLPCYLFIAVKSGQQLSDNWQGRPQMSIFLDQGIAASEAALIFDEIRLHPAIELAELVSPQQALDEFRSLSGMSYELDLLSENPLPFSIVSMPGLGHANSQRLAELQQQLSGIEGIETIRMDLAWTDRFNSLLLLFTKITLVLSTLLGLALILIVGNTIRLLIQNRRAEIEISKLVGGTDSFVRRPFLYYGALFGLGGGGVCVMLLWFSALWLAPTVAQLSSSYQGANLMYSLTSQDVFLLLGLATSIGWLAARWSVARHLRLIRPK